MTEEERNEKRMILVDWMEFYDLTHGTDEDIARCLTDVIGKQASKTQSFEDLELAPRPEKNCTDCVVYEKRKNAHWEERPVIYKMNCENCIWFPRLDKHKPYLSEEKKDGFCSECVLNDETLCPTEGPPEYPKPCESFKSKLSEERKEMK